MIELTVAALVAVASFPLARAAAARIAEVLG